MLNNSIVLYYMIKDILKHIIFTCSGRPCFAPYWEKRLEKKCNPIEENCNEIDDILSKPPYNQWDFSKEKDFEYVEKKKMPC